MNLRALLLVPCIALAACTSPPGSDGGLDAPDAGEDAPLPGATVELGSGQNDWEDVASSGGRTELVHGAQGGYHIWGRARFHGFHPDVDISFQVQRTDDGVVLHSPQWVRRFIENGRRFGLLDLGGGTFATDAELVILNIQCGSEVLGRQIRWQVFVRERTSGRVATQSAVVTVVDETPSPACGGPRG